MNAPLNSDSQLFSSSETGRSANPSSYSPSVPISVYPELATELKTTQTTLDALTHQNQQLLRQNTLLRTEIQRFLQSAEQLGHFAGVIPQDTMPLPQRQEDRFQPPPAPAPADLFQARSAPEPPLQAEPPAPEEAHYDAPPAPVPMPAPVAEAPVKRRDRPNSAPRMSSAIVPHPKPRKRDRGNPTSESHKYRLFTEQVDEGRPLSKVASRSDLGNLWLATTILLVVVSAFGAGFLIMRPLLSR